MKTINLKTENKKLQFESTDFGQFLVGDNDGYRMHFELDERRNAFFALFKKDGKEQKLLLDENKTVTVPLWCLKKGFFSVGIVSDGYATTPFIFEVQASIVDEKNSETEDEDPSAAEQLIALVNNLSLEGVSPELVEKAVENVLSENVFQDSLGLTVFGGKICIETEA